MKRSRSATCKRPHLVSLLLGVALVLYGTAAGAETNPFVVPKGLESAVEFWKQVFTRYSEHELVFHDPTDHSKVYSVLSVPENKPATQGIINNEYARITAAYNLRRTGGQVRSQRGAKEQFVISHNRSLKYIARMKKIFREEGLPAELAYLPHVESAFDLNAQSRAGAVGLWQLMPLAASRFLRTSNTYEGRKDPYASTRAATRIFKENYQALGNWPLAVTAYNYGATGVFKAAEAVGTDDLVEIIRRYNHPWFSYEPKNFYAEFLAVVELMKNEESLAIAGQKHHPFRLREVVLKRAVPIEPLLKTAAISQSQFLAWNEDLANDAKALPAGYAVKIPEERVERFVDVNRHLIQAKTASRLEAGFPRRRS